VAKPHIKKLQEEEKTFKESFFLTLIIFSIRRSLSSASLMKWQKQTKALNPMILFQKFTFSSVSLSLKLEVPKFVTKFSNKC